MRLDRMIPLSPPVHQPGRKEERPPRRSPEAADKPAAPGEPADEAGGDGRPVPPDHVDITV